MTSLDGFDPLTLPSKDDVYHVNVSGTCYKCAGEDALHMGFGSIYRATTHGSAQTLAVATPTKITQFNTNGPNVNATADHTNDRIRTDEVGHWVARFVGSMVGPTGDTLTTYIYQDGAEMGRVTQVLNDGENLVCVEADVDLTGITTDSDCELWCAVAGGGDVQLLVGSRLSFQRLWNGT